MVGELSHVLWKIKAMFETTNQYIYIYICIHTKCLWLNKITTKIEDRTGKPDWTLV